MKLKFTLCIFISLTLLLFSCDRKEPDYLSYQKYPMRVEGLLTVESLGCDISLVVEEMGEAEITVNSPEKLKDYRFTVDKDGIWVYYDDIEIPLSEEMLPGGLTMLSDMFSLDSKSLSEIGTQKIGDTEHLRLVYSCDDGSVVVYIKEGKEQPTLIEMINDDSNVLFAIDTIEYEN